MSRIKLVLAFLALVILAAGLITGAFYWKNIVRPDIEMVNNIEGNPKDKDKEKEAPDLGKRHFDEAVKFLKEGELTAAKDRLYYLLDFYPESGSYEEAKRILGEVNMDLLLSKIPMEGKSEYIVKRGEALVTIARKNKTTIDYIMRANSRTTALIYPDDSLTVFPLEFSANIDLSDKKVTLKQGEKYFKEYPIVRINLPAMLKAPINTTVSSKVAWNKGRPVNFTDKNYLDCQKWIQSKKMGLFIRHERETPLADGEKDTNYGVIVSKPDLEEIFTILRVGMPLALKD